jgi:glycosyltransferase involved in cell wall biosynthesis
VSQFEVSIVLGSYNRLSYLKKTILTIREEIESFQLEAEIIVVDGGSDDGSVQWLVEQRDIISIIQHNRGIWKGHQIKRRSWGYFMNLAFKAASGKFIMMVSDDCLVIPGSIRKGIDHFEKRLAKESRLGALAFYWRNWPQDKDYFVGLAVGKRMFVNHGLYLNSALQEVGYIDADSFHFYHADGDLVLRMWKKGYVCEAAPDSFIEHYADAKTSVRVGNLTKQKEDYDFYLKRWDEYYQENKYEGGWVYKSFVDSHKTYRHFQWLYYRDLLVSIPKKVFYKLIKKIRP